jgi:hypothetical protein
MFTSVSFVQILYKTHAFYAHTELIIHIFLLVEYSLRPTILNQQNSSWFAQLKRFQ